MKRITALCIACVMFLSLAACIGATKEEGKSESENTQQATTEKVTAAAAKDTKPSETEKPKETAYKIDNETIVDNAYCTVTLVSCQAKRNGGVDFKFLLENKTADKEMMFSMDDVAVNGWIISSLFVKTVSAGKKASETLSFSASSLNDCGLTSVDKLQFHLRVYDNDDWMADEFVEDTFIIYPTGLTEAEIVSPERRTGKDEMTAVDDENSSFIILETYVDSIWGYTVVAYLENKTENTDMMFSWNDVSVNGYMIDPFWATSIPAGTKKIAEIHFSSSKLEENGIDKIDEIEFELRIYDSDDWFADDFLKDVFIYTPTKK